MTCGSAAALRATVEGRGLRFSDGAITFADRCGGILQLESAAGRGVWRELSAVPVSVHANHLLAPSLRPLEDRGGGWGENFLRDSRSRQQRLEELLGVGGGAGGEGEGVSVERMQRVLADRGAPHLARPCSLPLQSRLRAKAVRRVWSLNTHSSIYARRRRGVPRLLSPRGGRDLDYRGLHRRPARRDALGLHWCAGPAALTPPLPRACAPATMRPPHSSVAPFLPHPPFRRPARLRRSPPLPALPSDPAPHTSRRRGRPSHPPARR
eukprot:SAG11_NODE_5564_length_1522_cov_1.874912_2_plen_266_part_01